MANILDLVKEAEKQLPQYVSGMKIIDFNIKIYANYKQQKGGFIWEYVESGGTFSRGETPDFSKSQNKILYKTLRKKYGI